MMVFKVLSVDMFQTIVDLKGRRHGVWREILNGRYSREKAEMGWRAGNQVLIGLFEKIIAGKLEFIPMKEVFVRCFTDIFNELELDCDPSLAAKIIMHQHSLCKPYDDALPFLNSIGQHIPVCLTSDSNQQMLGSLDRLYPFDHIFISEDYQSYKLDPAGGIFKGVLNHYKIPAHSILHIGDSCADILGAAGVGIQTCWLNRNGAKWHQKIRPDYEVTDLYEAKAMIMDNLNLPLSDEHIQ